MPKLKLRTREYLCLVEASRRWHGSYTDYKQALEGGYMTYATDPNPGYQTWWRLTYKGAGVIKAWLDQGLDAERLNDPNDLLSHCQIVPAPRISDEAPLPPRLVEVADP